MLFVAVVALLLFVSTTAAATAAAERRSVVTLIEQSAPHAGPLEDALRRQQQQQDVLFPGRRKQGHHRARVVKAYGRRLVLAHSYEDDDGEEEEERTHAFVRLHLRGRIAQIEPDAPIVGLSSNSAEAGVSVDNVTAATADILTPHGLEWYYDTDEAYGTGAAALWPAYAPVGAREVVAVVDSGLAVAAGPLFPQGLAAGGYDFVSSSALSGDGDGRDPDPTDPGDQACGRSGWHGTKMAAAIAGQFAGQHAIAPNTSLQILRVLGACSTGYASDAADAIVWASGGVIDGLGTSSSAAAVVSLSFVGRGACPSYLQSAIAQAVGRGVLVVAAAGNDAADAAGYFPANCVGAVRVGASTRAGDLAAYSNYDVDLLAPGGDADAALLTVTVDAATGALVPAVSAGTSFAAAFAAGAAVMLRALGPQGGGLFLRTHVAAFAPASRCVLLQAGGLEETTLCGDGLLRLGNASSVGSNEADATDSVTTSAFSFFDAPPEVTTAALLGEAGVHGVATCTAGTYLTSANAPACVNCGTGTYSTGVGGILACSACANGTYALAGSSACAACVANSTQPVAGGGYCVASPGYAFAPSGTRFPSSGMGAATATIGGEAFVASASSYITAGSPEPAWGAFNYILQTNLGNAPQDWTSSSSAAYTTAVAGGLKGYTGTGYATVIDGTTYYGEWLQLQVGAPRQLAQHSLQAALYNGARAPSMFVVGGSTDGTAWTLLDNQTTLTPWTANSIQTFLTPRLLGNRSFFTYFRLVVLATGSTGDGYVSIEEWMLYNGTVAACGAGLFAASSGASACAQCAGGTYASQAAASACSACANGTFSPWAAASVCGACAGNTSSGAGASACSANAGYYDLGASLMAYYPFLASNPLADTTGRAGSLFGAAGGYQLPTSNTATVPYAGGASLGFVSASLQTAAIPNITLPDPYSVCFYLYLSTVPGAGQPGPTAFQFSVAAANSDWSVFYDNGYGDAYYRFREATGGVFVGDVSLPANSALATTWAHYCMTWSGQRASIWTNGQPTVVSGTPTGGTLQNRALKLYTNNLLGASNVIGGSPNNWLNGYLDEFMIFNRSLSNAEAQAVYALQSAVGSPTIPIVCAAGTYAASNSSVCTACAAGAYASQAAASACSACAAGTYATGVGSNASLLCVACAAGAYSSGAGMSNASACQNCSAGSFTNSSGASACALCAAGTYATASSGSSACAACPNNTWSSAGYTACYNNTYPIFALVGQNAGAGYVRSINLGTGAVTTLTTALINGESAISPDGSYALLCDGPNNVVRKVVFASGNTAAIVAGISGTAGWLDNAVGTSAKFSFPYGIAISPDGTYALIADLNNNAIRRMDLTAASSFAVTTLAGTCSGSGCTAGAANGPALSSTFTGPYNVDIHPSGNYSFVADRGNNLIRRIDLSLPSAVVSTVGASSSYNAPSSVRISSDGASVLIADRYNSALKVMSIATQAVTTAYTFSSNVLDAAWLGLGDGIVMVDFSGNKVDLVSYPGGALSLLAGSGTAATTDGTGAAAAFAAPITLSVWRCMLPGMGVDASDYVCQRCSAGKYANGYGLCAACPTGLSSVLGSTACGLCAAGGYALAASAGCSLCAAGSFASAASTASACTACAAGVYATGAGATACVANPPVISYYLLPANITAAPSQFYCGGSGSVQTVCGTGGCTSGCQDVTKSADNDTTTQYNGATGSQNTNYLITYCFNAPVLPQTYYAYTATQGDVNHDRGTWAAASSVSGAVQTFTVTRGVQPHVMQFSPLVTTPAACWSMQTETQQYQLYVTEAYWSAVFCPPGFYLFANLSG